MFRLNGATSQTPGQPEQIFMTVAVARSANLDIAGRTGPIDSRWLNICIYIYVFIGKLLVCSHATTLYEMTRLLNSPERALTHALGVH